MRPARLPFFDYYCFYRITSRSLCGGERHNYVNALFFFRVITPRPSRPPSAELAPLTKSPPESPTFLSPSNARANAAGGGSRPSSRPASLLLRDALINMFGGSSEG